MYQEVLKLDRNWVPQEWITVKKAIEHEATDEVIEHLGEKIFVYHGGKNRFTGEQSVVETSSIIVVAGEPSPRKYRDPALTNDSLFKRDLHMCAYCGQVFSKGDLTRDHIHPQNPEDSRIAKGRDIWMNVVTACKSCNSLKGNILPGQMLPKVNGVQVWGPQGTGRMDPLYLPYVPCKAEHMIMKGKVIQGDQMEFLVKMIKNPNSRVLKAHK